MSHTGLLRRRKPTGDLSNSQPPMKGEPILPQFLALSWILRMLWWLALLRCHIFEHRCSFFIEVRLCTIYTLFLEESEDHTLKTPRGRWYTLLLRQGCILTASCLRGSLTCHSWNPTQRFSWQPHSLTPVLRP